MTPDASPRFVTFYSYKGGVGRSMALANVASWLVTGAHKRVVAIDFDLEAPGLTYYFGPSGLLGDAPLPGPGLVELLTKYRTEGAVPDLSDYVISGPPQLGGGQLHLLCAGEHRSESYAGDLAALDWNALYEHGYGFELMEHLRVSIIDGYQPDIVLIDSRTGLHGIGAIAAQHLPDAVVLLFSLNQQNVDGTAEVLGSIERNIYAEETGRAIETLLVASPVYEPGLPEAAEAIDRAERTLGRSVDARIPFSSAAVYGESVWRVGDQNAPGAVMQEYARMGQLLDDGLRPARTSAADPSRPDPAARVFELQGFSTAPPSDPRVRVDLVATKEELLGTSRVGVVRLSGTGRGQAGLVQETAKQLRKGKLDSAVIVTEAAPTKVIETAAAREPKISVVGEPQLLDRLIDWRPYLHWLADETAGAAWEDHVGRLQLRGWPDPPPSGEPADRWLGDDWMGDDVPLTLLVGPESGRRSTLSRWFAHDLAQAALKREYVSAGRLPVLLPLGRYRRELDVDQLLADLLADRRHFGQKPSPVDRVRALHLLNELGRIVFVVEELDTLPEPDQAMHAIAELAGPRAKILVNRYVPGPAVIARAGLPRHHTVTFSTPAPSKG